MSKSIDKIKNYNQITLAVAGTLGVLFLIFAAFFVLQEISRPFFTPKNNDNQGILAIEETDQLNKDSLRKQIISFTGLQVIDSINQLSVIPVTQANLLVAERDSRSFGLMDSKFSGRSYERSYRNVYNNLVLHEYLNNQSQIIFEDRISFENFIMHEDEQNKFIVIPACKVDSNKDGYLNENDLQELFIFDLQNRQLHKIESNEHYTTLKVFQPHQSTDLVAYFGIDRNDNGSYDKTREPMIFYRVNLETMMIEEYVSKEQIQELQFLLEGKG